MYINILKKYSQNLRQNSIFLLYSITNCPPKPFYPLRIPSQKFLGNLYRKIHIYNNHSHIRDQNNVTKLILMHQNTHQNRQNNCSRAKQFYPVKSAILIRHFFRTNEVIENKHNQYKDSFYFHFLVVVVEEYYHKSLLNYLDYLPVVAFLFVFEVQITKFVLDGNRLEAKTVFVQVQEEI